MDTHNFKIELEPLMITSLVNDIIVSSVCLIAYAGQMAGSHFVQDFTSFMDQ